MKGIIEMKIRMTWDQIKNNYPERWVRLEQVVWESEGSPDIASAVVAKATKSARLARITKMLSLVNVQ